MNEELREAVVFLKPKWQGSDDTSKHIQTLLDLATTYLEVKGMPEEKKEIVRGQTYGGYDSSDQAEDDEVEFCNKTLHLCKLAFLKKMEEMEKVIEVALRGCDFNSYPAKSRIIATAIRTYLLEGEK